MRSRPLFAWITALTSLGLLGALVDFVGFFPANGGIRVGCGGLAGVLFFALMFILILLGGIAGIALGGLNMYWRGSLTSPRPTSSAASGRPSVSRRTGTCNAAGSSGRCTCCGQPTGT